MSEIEDMDVTTKLKFIQETLFAHSLPSYLTASD